MVGEANQLVMCSAPSENDFDIQCSGSTLLSTAGNNQCGRHGRFTIESGCVDVNQMGRIHWGLFHGVSVNSAVRKKQEPRYVRQRSRLMFFTQRHVRLCCYNVQLSSWYSFRGVHVYTDRCLPVMERSSLENGIDATARVLQDYSHGHMPIIRCELLLLGAGGCCYGACARSNVSHNVGPKVRRVWLHGPRMHGTHGMVSCREGGE